jgi:sensor c-di-GMP phosphodiesterase-like protein
MFANNATRLRADALVAAERERIDATHDADVEFSETVSKLREQYENGVAEATRYRLARVTPAHQTYNRAVVAAERNLRARAEQ